MQDRDFDRIVLDLSEQTTRRGAFRRFLASIIGLWTLSARSVAAQVECGLSQRLCSGTCVDTSNDARNCGSCGVACHGSEICSFGRCTATGGGGGCNGTGGDIFSDPYNCGKCGYVCPEGSTCQYVVCRCPYGTESCSYGCVNTFTDPANCGACGVVCSSGHICYKGSCGNDSVPTETEEEPSPDSPSSSSAPSHFPVLDALPLECFTPDVFAIALPREIDGVSGPLTFTDGGAADPSAGVNGHAYLYVASYGIPMVVSRWVELEPSQDLNELLVAVRSETIANNGLILRDGTGVGVVIPTLLLEIPSTGYVPPEYFYFWGYEGSQYAFSLQSSELDDIVTMLTSLVAAMRMPNVCGPGIDPEDFPG